LAPFEEVHQAPDLAIGVEHGTSGLAGVGAEKMRRQIHVWQGGKDEVWIFKRKRLQHDVDSALIRREAGTPVDGFGFRGDVAPQDIGPFLAPGRLAEQARQLELAEYSGSTQRRLILLDDR